MEDTELADAERALKEDKLYCLLVNECMRQTCGREVSKQFQRETEWTFGMNEPQITQNVSKFLIAATRRLQ